MSNEGLRAAVRQWLRRLAQTVRPHAGRAGHEAELRAHLDFAADEARRRGLSESNARRAALVEWGGMTQALEAMHDQRGLPWLETMRADLVYAWRQLSRHRAATLAAVLSLGLAIGATAGAFRLLDAVVLRSLPVAAPDRLFMLTLNTFEASGRPGYRDDLDYPEFRRFSAAAADVADSLLVGSASRIELTFGTPDESERVYRQFVSGNVFPVFGLTPAAGRLFGVTDDATPGGHPIAVLSDDFWSRRFGRDPAVIGRSFVAGGRSYEIVGVAPAGFTGTEPGRMTDVFLPSKMNVQALDSPGWSWFRMWMRPRDEAAPDRVRQMVQAALTQEHEIRARTFPADTPPDQVKAFLGERVDLVPASGGASGLQRAFRQPLLVVLALGALVLLVACANVANLLATRALARSHEFALRVSIGASRRRLVRMVLVESALLAGMASLAGLLFARWSAPFVVSLLTPPDDPVRLVLAWDVRAMAASALVAFVVVGLVGLAPAIRASTVNPVGAMRREDTRVTRRRLPGVLAASQMAFSVLVLFIASLFGTTFVRLANQPTGFSDRRVLVLETMAGGGAGTVQGWDDVVTKLRAVPGVEAAAVAGWAPLSDNGWRGRVRIETRQADVSYASVAGGLFGTLGIAVKAGRDFRPDDRQPRLEAKVPQPGVGIVNEMFVKTYLDGQPAVDRSVMMRQDDGSEAPLTIVGVVGDVMYRSVRDPIRPIVYLPMPGRNNGAILVRTAGEPLAMVPALRTAVAQANPRFRAVNIGLQEAQFRRQIVRERLLATLSGFFAVVAMLVALVGLFGVLQATVDQRQREVGIRLALGARAWHVIRRVVAPLLTLVGAGGAVGLAGGIALGRLVDSLLFRVSATDPAAVLVPIGVLSVAALVAVLHPVRRVLRIDPVRILKAD